MPIIWETSHSRSCWITSILPPKTLDYNLIYYKLVLKENKKRKTNDASTSSEEPPHNELDDDDFWANLNVEDEEAREEPPLPHEDEN